MKLEQVKQKLQEGEKLTHRFFGNDEYITQRGNKIVTEEGYSFSIQEFFQIRNTIEWQKDWSIYSESFTQAELEEYRNYRLQNLKKEHTRNRRDILGN
jgi:hypothetical protein